MTDDDARAQELRDETEILGLLARLAHAMDSAPEVETFLALLAPGIEWGFAENPRAGTAASTMTGTEVLASWVRSRRASGNQGPGSGTRHLVGSAAVRLTGTASARAQSYFALFATGPDGTVLRAAGSYDDELCRIDGRWLLLRRVITV